MDTSASSEDNAVSLLFSAFDDSALEAVILRSDKDLRLRYVDGIEVSARGALDERGFEHRGSLARMLLRELSGVKRLWPAFGSYRIEQA